MKRVFKAHPLMIIDFVKPYLFILIFPFLKGAIQYLVHNEVSGVLRLELIAFAVISLIAGLRYNAFRIVCGREKVIVETGFLIKTRSVINVSKLSSVQTTQNPIDAVFRSVTYRINTEAGRTGGTDFEFKLGVKDSREVSKLLFGEQDPTAVKFSAVKVAVMAATTSSAATGLIVGVPIINKAGNLLGLALSQMLFDEINNVSGKMHNFFPPIVNTITLIILLAYGVSFLYSFLKYINFKLFLEKDNLEVRSGFFVRSRTRFSKKAVNCVLIEQTPLMRIFCRYAIKVSVGGYNNSSSKAAVVVPSGKREEIKEHFSAYFPFLQPEGKSVRAKRSFITQNRFLFLAEICFLIIVASSITLSLIFKDFSRFILFLTLVAGDILIYYALLSLFEYRFGKLKLGENICARSIKVFNTCEFYCPKERVGEIRLIRYPPDLYFKTCKAVVYVRSESADHIRLRHLDYEEVKKSIAECYGIEV